LKTAALFFCFSLIFGLLLYFLSEDSFCKAFKGLLLDNLSEDSLFKIFWLDFFKEFVSISYVYADIFLFNSSSLSESDN